MIPSTFLSLHDITGLKAIALQSLDTPLVLRIESEHGMFQISLYGLHADRVERIADAINSIMLEPVPTPKVQPSETAAYKSHDDYMACLIRDLNRDPIEVPK
jgi:hypothetical protein